jgi:UDP:flavonoid glycosyltransferase YjiC (YdhE family)
MRVLMTTTGYAGHFVPLVPFARACVRSGHELRVVAPRAHGAAVTAAGLELHACADPAPEDLARLVATIAELPRRDGHAHMMREGFARTHVLAVLHDVLEAVESWRPDVVVRESQEYAGALAAERAGIPHARVALGLAAQENDTLALAAPAVDELRAELGLPGDPEACALRESPYLTLVPAALEEPDASAQPVTHRFRVPASLPAARDGRRRATAPAVGRRHVTAPLAPDRGGVARDDARPLVYLTFGSVAALMGLHPRVYRAAIDALADVPAQLLVTVGEGGDPAALGPLLPNVHVERWVPQDTILGRAAAVVCHGGYGSVLGALAHGVPVVALPIFADDQWRNARRVAEVGAGIAVDDDPDGARRMLDGPGPEAFGALPAAVEAVLREPGGHRRAARAVADAIAALPPVDDAAGVLEAMAAQPRVEGCGPSCGVAKRPPSISSIR